MANPAANRPGPGTTPGPEDTAPALRDQKTVDLRRDGLSYAEIGTALEVPKSTVADSIKRWLDERGLSAEQVDELRQFQGAQLDAYQAKLAPHLFRPFTRRRRRDSLRRSRRQPPSD